MGGKVTASKRKNTDWYKNNLSFRGKTHKLETKEKIGKTNSINQKGVKNSQFGTMWITNGTDNKKIKKDSCIPLGWYKGRITKNK